MTNYRRGREFEHRVRRMLEGDGYFTVRSAGSRGLFDLVALQPGTIPMLIQVRIDGRLSSGKEEKRHAHDPITELTLLVVL